ncbi:MAG: hypothetical protein ACJASQ_003079 [Crocinitomicaceae bacterium]|jgi:hypothetical protein
MELTDQVPDENYMSWVKEIISSASDNFLRHYENEIRVTQEQGKLSLWITGISIALEFFFLYTLNKSDFDFWTIILFSIITAMAAFNGGVGLYIQLTKVKLIDYYLDYINAYDYQKNQLLLELKRSNSITAIMVRQDFKSENGTKKLGNLGYYDEKPDHNTDNFEKKRKFLRNSSKWPTILLIVQVVLCAILFVYINYN